MVTFRVLHGADRPQGVCIVRDRRLDGGTTWELRLCSAGHFLAVAGGLVRDTMEFPYAEVLAGRQTLPDDPTEARKQGNSLGFCLFFLALFVSRVFPLCVVTMVQCLRRMASVCTVAHTMASFLSHSQASTADNTRVLFVFFCFFSGFLFFSRSAWGQGWPLRVW